MARIRTIKPDFWTDEKMGRLKRDARLMFIGLLNLADDSGILKALPAYIKGQLFPYDEELRVKEVESWLESLVKARILIPFTYQDEGYYMIRTFRSHQKIDKPTKSKIPNDVIVSVSENIRRGFAEDSPLEIEGKGKEIEGKGERRTNVLTLEQRKRDFGEALVPFVEEFGKELIRAFFDYWTEPDKHEKKMRYEGQKFFDIKKRLATWQRNEKSNWGGGAAKKSKAEINVQNAISVADQLKQEYANEQPDKNF